jgi:hypothetical protein
MTIYSDKKLLLVPAQASVRVEQELLPGRIPVLLYERMH